MRRLNKATISDVAKLAKVCERTVTLAFAVHKQASIAPATRQRVLAAAAELRYRPSLMAQAMKSRKSRTVCLPFIMSGDERYNTLGVGPITLMYNDSIHGALPVLNQIGYRLEPFHPRSKEEAEQALPEMFLAGYFDAVFFPHGELNKTAEEMARDGCIVVGSMPPVEGLPNLIHVRSATWGPDFAPMVEELTRQGRSHLLFTFPIPKGISNSYSKDIKSGKIRLQCCDQPDRSRSRHISAIVEAVLLGSIDAIVTPDEFFGWDIFKALHASGVEVPERVTITGAADVRHVFKPLPILQLFYATKATQLREIACRFAEYLVAEDHLENIVIPPPHRTSYGKRIQVLNATQFLAAARAELCREHLQSEVEAEFLQCSES